MFESINCPSAYEYALHIGRYSMYVPYTPPTLSLIAIDNYNTLLSAAYLNMRVIPPSIDRYKKCSGEFITTTILLWLVFTD